MSFQNACTPDCRTHEQRRVPIYHRNILKGKMCQFPIHRLAHGIWGRKVGVTHNELTTSRNGRFDTLGYRSRIFLLNPSLIITLGKRAAGQFGKDLEPASQQMHRSHTCLCVSEPPVIPGSRGSTLTRLSLAASTQSHFVRWGGC